MLRPLFSLSFFCAEFLKQERLFGARQVIISSASSKTALGLAFPLTQGPSRSVAITGLTSARNAEFAAQRGVYERALGYRAIASLPKEPAVFIDIAGDAGVRAHVHEHLHDSLQHSARIGFTHWDALGSIAPNLPGPTPDTVLHA